MDSPPGRSAGEGAGGRESPSTAGVDLPLREALRLPAQEGERRLQEAVARMEQQLQRRDEALLAAGHAVEERLQRLEARVAAMEEGQGQGALERRMGALEEAVQRALATVFPRVDALVAHLERTTSVRPAAHSTSAQQTSSSTSAQQTSPSTSAQPTTPSSTSSGLTTADDEEQERRRVEERVLQMYARAERAEAEPSSQGEDLCEAAFDGSLRIVRQLLASGADVNYVSRHGATPLISAFYRSFEFGKADSDVVLALLEKGADVNAVDTSGSSALHYAVFLNSGAWVSLMVAAGARVNARDEFGATPLHRAALYGYQEAVRALVAVGADKKLRCWTGDSIHKTAFDVAEIDAVRNLLRP